MLLHLMEQLRMSMGSGRVTMALLRDFSVAFNSLYISTIIRGLIEAGLPDCVVKLVVDCFSDRTLQVVQGKVRS